jgi:hypothetical protein
LKFESKLKYLLNLKSSISNFQFSMERSDMEEKANRLAERLLDYGVAILKLTMKLDASLPGKHVAGQLF